MNKYKRIFHHIDFKEAKSKHLEDLAVKKLEEEKNIKKEKQISKITEEKKYSWRETLKEAEWVALDTGGIANKTTQTFGLTDLGFPVIGPDFNQVTANFGGLGGVDVQPSEVGYMGGEGESSTTPPPTYNQLALAGFTKPLPMFRRQGEANAKEINSRLQAGQDFAQATGADAYMNARLEDEKKAHDLKMTEWATDALQALKDIQGNQELEVEDVVQTDRWELQKLVSAHNQSLYRKIDALENKLQDNYFKRQDMMGYGTKEYGQYSYGGNYDATTAEFDRTHVLKYDPAKKMHSIRDVGRTKKLLKLKAEDAAANKEIIELKKQFKDDPPKFDPFVPNNIGTSYEPPSKTTLDTVPLASAKAVFDYYLEEFLKNPHSGDVDLTNLISTGDIKWLSNFIEEYVDENSRDADKWHQFMTAWNEKVTGGIAGMGIGTGTVPWSLRNILGDIGVATGEGFSEDDNYYYIRKHYDFTDENDLKAPGAHGKGKIGKWEFEFDPAGDYAKKKGIMKWFNTGKGSGEDGNGTPTMHILIRIPKKKDEEDS